MMSLAVLQIFANYRKIKEEVRKIIIDAGAIILSY